MPYDDEKDKVVPRPRAFEPPPKDEDLELRERCAGDRSEMEPHETADCAGQDLVEQYQNEEDGGS